VVAFTFTERAAEALKSRIELRIAERLGDGFLDRMNGCFVGTIHAYCFRLLQQHVPRYETYDVLDEHRLAAFLTREANRIGIKDLTGQLFSSIRTFLANVDVVDNELLRTDQLEDPFREMVECFAAQLEQYRLLTYGQLVARAVRELDRTEVFTSVHGPLRHLIVDEYQDVNPAQEALVRRLAARPVELCVVGDDDQSIYQWRGSDVGNIVTFAERYRRVARFEITTNRRSRPRLRRRGLPREPGVLPQDERLGVAGPSAQGDARRGSAGQAGRVPVQPLHPGRAPKGGGARDRRQRPDKRGSGQP
jgi:DNA helicase II / ATP-dependent DNA helicase PcrA